MYRLPSIFNFRISLFLAFLMVSLLSSNLMGQFTLSGSATALGDSCFRITPATTYQVGSIWSTNKVSLTNSFEIFTHINFGSQDNNGADGMTFSLQPVNNTVGTTGKGMGMEGISPSFFVEFDTYQNSDLSDPAYDHMAILKNGVVDHASTNNLVGPDSISSTSDNVEDGMDHLVHFKWNAHTNTFQIFMDCVLRITYTGDIINTIFSGNPNVYWGFTGSTGALTNDQNFCFLYIFFEGTDHKEICKGDSVQIGTYPGTYFNWRPYDGLSDFSVQNPVASPDSTTTYFVKYANLCGETRYDTVVVNVRQPDISRDSIYLCQGDSTLVDGQYIKNTGIYNTDTLKAGDFCDSLVYQTYVQINPLPAVGGYDTTFCPPQDFTLAIYSDSTASYQWSNGASGATTIVNAAGDYYVDISKGGCTQRSYFHLSVGDYCTAEIEPANVFTPNGDGVNDFFPGKAVSNIIDFQMNIYNRWGRAVYNSSDIAKPWDGTIQGKEAAEGVYYYLITYASIYDPGSQKSLKGSLTLVR